MDAFLKQRELDMKVYWISALGILVLLPMLAHAEVILHVDGTVLRANPAFGQIFGYPPEELVGRYLDELIVPAEKIAESRDHAVGFRRVFRNERRDRVQGIEKEMRMKLHLERAQLRLGELCP